MGPEWNEQQPIYRQIRDLVAAMMLDGFLKEGDALPSVRNVAADYRVNPLTVLKAYQALVDEGLVEKRRGLGMYIDLRRARAGCSMATRSQFLAEQWPPIHATIQRLGLSPQTCSLPTPTAQGGLKTMACIQARGLRKTYGTTVALDSIDLHVDTGRIVGLIGPNGAGKTTALNAMLGLMPYEGELERAGPRPLDASATR